MELIVIGGGCYGCLHTRQLLKAQRRGKIAASGFVLVDHNPACRALSEFADEPLVRVVRDDWAHFLAARLATASTSTDDQLVPAPFAPHLLFDWLFAAVERDLPAARLRRGTADLSLGLPFEQSGPGGIEYISAADWLCPVMCIEPALCPAIRAPRSWELGDIVHAGVRTGVPLATLQHRQAAAVAQMAPAPAVPSPYTGAELFTCRHFAWGVGTIPVAALAQARARIRERIAAAVVSGEAQRIVVGTVSACHGVLGVLETAPE